MIITNCRILWKPSAEASLPVQIFRAPISLGSGLNVQAAFNKKGYWVLKIEVPETKEMPNESFYFRFLGPTGKPDCEKVEAMLR